MNSEAYKKFNNAVVGGIGMFVTLRLRGFPAEQNVDAMIDLWLAVLAPLRQWDDEDIVNLQNAFIATARSATEWPMPKTVIDQLEPKIRVSKASLPKSKTEAEKQEIDNIVNRILNNLSINNNEEKTNGKSKNKV